MVVEVFMQKMKSSLQMPVMCNFIIQQNSIRQKSLLPEPATEPRSEGRSYVPQSMENCSQIYNYYIKI